MPILNGTQIQERIRKAELIRDAKMRPSGEADVEAASYDLRVGTILWKDRQTGDLRMESYVANQEGQAAVTLHPGQMIFVMTQEEIRLPLDLCGTVYSRNKLQKENILALNAGHVDPGYDGPILIRLINLSAQPWALAPGDAVFTIVFHTVAQDPNAEFQDRRTKQETLKVAASTAMQAFSNPFHDLYKDEIARQLQAHYSEAESKIRVSLQSEYVRRDQLTLRLLIASGSVIGGVLLLSRVPWDKVGVWLKYWLHL
ncbi:MAG: dcd [Candidatus Sulfotelmatobacter sp.]|nr:dcd [Candidatus Sulfotelmatobacter sp.]